VTPTRSPEQHSRRSGDRRPALKEKFQFQGGAFFTNSVKRLLHFNNSFLREVDAVNWKTLTARFLQKDGNSLLMEVDLEVYGMPALLKVAHKFTDRCFVHLQRRNEQIVEVRFEARDLRFPLEPIAGEFCNEVLDQRLREILARESEPVRNLILAHALSGIGLTDTEDQAPQNHDPGAK
jgi:His-Xaa-Ser system protein HxsD